MLIWLVEWNSESLHELMFYWKREFSHVRKWFTAIVLPLHETQQTKFNGFNIVLTCMLFIKKFLFWVRFLRVIGMADKLWIEECLAFTQLIFICGNFDCTFRNNLFGWLGRFFPTNYQQMRREICGLQS